MVKVYFESKGSAEAVAYFIDEETYDACSPILGGLARQSNLKVTESIDEDLKVLDNSKLLELASTLAHDKLVNDYGSTIDIYKDVHDECLEYSEEAQDIFNENFDYYFDLIKNI